MAPKAFLMPALVRLYISPLTPELLPKVIPSSLLPLASDISFHYIQTFPERGYGYLNLPTMEADKIKKKLSGSIFKGSKVKVEEARTKNDVPDITGNEVLEDNDGEGSNIRKSERKRKREDGVLPGYQLPEGRKVKRGWTEPAEKSKKPRLTKVGKDELGRKDRKKKAQKSAYTDKAECLFKTKLPPNRSETPDKVTKAKKRGKQAPEGKETVVHEFEKTTKHPTFLRDGSKRMGKKLVKEYDETKGWVDEDGNVVEQAPAKTTRRSKVLTVEKNPASIKPVVLTTREKSKSPSSQKVPLDDETSSSGSSSLAEDSDPENPPSDPLPSLEVSQSSPATAERHPLETLFKKPKAPAQDDGVASRKVDLEVKIPFSFFGDENHSQDEDNESGDTRTTTATSSKKAKARSLPNLSIPQTPFTQRDRHWRSQRSAAPTPDTAAPSRATFGSMWNRDGMEDDIDEDDEEEEVEGEGEDQANDHDKIDTAPTPSGKAKPKEQNGEKPESDFSKWFWENRGDTNRAWKKRRREAGKEKRQKENKRRAKNAL